MGTMFPTLKNVTSLGTIILKRNNIMGPMLESLVNLLTLKMLDVNDNKTSSVLPSFPASTMFMYSQNALIFTEGPSFLVEAPTKVLLLLLLYHHP